MKETESQGLKDSRDLGAARSAYSKGDRDASRRAHTLGDFDDFDTADELHKAESGKYLKSVVFGGLDGIITTFAIVSAVAGSGLSAGIVIIMGFANLFADGVSMGMGDFLSSQAEQEWALAERERELWETENYLEGEQKEMIELWQAKGLSRQEAKTVIDILSQHKDLFVDIMMVEELGIMIEDESPWKHGVVTFISFCVFGVVPLLVYLAFLGWTTSGDDVGFDIAFALSGFLTGCTLFTLGALKSKFTNQAWYISGFLTLLYGGFAACIAFAIGFVLELSGLADDACDDSS